MPLRSFAGGRLFGECFGSGMTRVVALHGWGRDRRDFDGALKGFDAVALDLPGFGVSPTPDRATGAAGYADILAPWLEGLRRPQVLVGHSFGGRVAMVLAAERPELVAGLVLVGVPLLRPAARPAAKLPLAYRLVRWGHRVGLVSDDRLERERWHWGSPDYRMASGVMRDILVKVVNESYEDELARVGCPVRMVWGADDMEVPLEVALRSADLVEDVNLDVIPECGHDVPGVAPERIRNAIEVLL